MHKLSPPSHPCPVPLINFIFITDILAMLIQYYVYRLHLLFLLCRYFRDYRHRNVDDVNTISSLHRFIGSISPTSISSTLQTSHWYPMCIAESIVSCLCRPFDFLVVQGNFDIIIITSQCLKATVPFKSLLGIFTDN